MPFPSLPPSSLFLFFLLLSFSPTFSLTSGVSDKESRAHIPHPTHIPKRPEERLAYNWKREKLFRKEIEKKVFYTTDSRKFEKILKGTADADKNIMIAYTNSGLLRKGKGKGKGKRKRKRKRKREKRKEKREKRKEKREKRKEKREKRKEKREKRKEKRERFLPNSSLQTPSLFPFLPFLNRVP